MNAASEEAATTFKFPKAASLADAEKQILRAGELDDDTDVQALIPSSFRRELMADIWSGLAVGTLLRRKPDAKTIAWGITRAEDFAPRKFALTPAGLVTAAFGQPVFTESLRDHESLADVLDWIRLDEKGYVAHGRGAERWIIEFDNSRALSLRAASSREDTIDRRVFEQLLSRVRSELEVWWEREREAFKGVPHADQVDHRKDTENLSLFVRELFENAYQHGRVFDPHGEYSPNLRFVRFRKLVAYDADKLYAIAGQGAPILQEFVKSVIARNREDALFEICISDFGAGIVDKFLSTPAGQKYASHDRTAVLHGLLYGDLTSNATDSAAGHGITYALEAARRAGAFVSLRTNEFWCARNFGTRRLGIELDEVTERKLGSVAGTHWQMIWAPAPG